MPASACRAIRILLICWVLCGARMFHKWSAVIPYQQLGQAKPQCRWRIRSRPARRAAPAAALACGRCRALLRLELIVGRMLTLTPVGLRPKGPQNRRYFHGLILTRAAGRSYT
ncbi:hypothetical protein V8C86DRAFT_2794652 [Haematococcus lacustris]